jgi:energy-converting hydrogenase Eha subunit A
MIMVTSIGFIALAAAGVMYWWGIPRFGEESRLPQSWGLRTVFPTLVMCFGVLGVILLAKGLLL